MAFAMTAPRQSVEALTAQLDVRQLYRETASGLRSTLRRLTNGADVDDLLHDVFVTALTQQTGLKMAQSPRAWLYGIALKKAASHRRRAWLKDVFGVNENLADPRRLPDSSAEAKQAEVLVSRALALMHGPKREVFVLFELEGFSGQEISVMVDCPLKTVWTRLHHARIEFAEVLKRVTTARNAP